MVGQAVLTERTIERLQRDARYEALAVMKEAFIRQLAMDPSLNEARDRILVRFNCAVSVTVARIARESGGL